MIAIAIRLVSASIVVVAAVVVVSSPIGVVPIVICPVGIVAIGIAIFGHWSRWNWGSRKRNGSSRGRNWRGHRNSVVNKHWSWNGHRYCGFNYRIIVALQSFTNFSSASTLQNVRKCTEGCDVMVFE